MISEIKRFKQSKSIELKDDPFIIQEFLSSYEVQQFDQNYFLKSFPRNLVPLVDQSFLLPGRSYLDIRPLYHLSRAFDIMKCSSFRVKMFALRINRSFSSFYYFLKQIPKPKGVINHFFYGFAAGKGSRVDLHFDYDHSGVFHILIWGKKRVRLVSPQYNDIIPQRCFSSVSVLSLDELRQRHPNLCYYDFVLEAGEALFIPPGHWHEMVYESFSFGVSMRSLHPQWSRRIIGVCNVFIKTKLDKFLNKLIPDAWHEFKHKKSLLR